jgi:proteasome lid subunit RPN8/RPN11
MIKLKKELYNELIKINEHEQCGFVPFLGSEETFVSYEHYKVKNVAKNVDNFRMGFWSKLFSLLKILFKRYDGTIIYHVHSKTPYLSKEDVKGAISGFVYLIIYKGNLLFFKIDKENGLNIEKLNYEVF